MADVSYININGTQYTIDDLQATQELADVRVGADGQTYASAGEAVRAQIEAVNESMTEAQGDITAIYDEIDTVKGDVSTAQGDITTLQGNVSDLQTDVSAIEGNFASEFSASTTYAIGDYCVYNGSLYKAVNAHTGAWNAADFEEVTVSGELEDIAETLENVDETLENKANIDGSYETMTVGNAEQLVATVGVDDSAPYNFRPSGGSADIGDRETVNAVVGGTVAWNQLLQNGNFADDSVWKYMYMESYSVSNNVLEFTINAERGRAYQSIDIVSGHKYLACVDIKLTTATTSVRFGMLINNGSSWAKYRFTNATIDWQTLTIISSPVLTNGSNNISVRDERADGWDAIKIRRVNLFDLTAMFGSTIADYIYNLEQANAGAGVAWFRKLFPKDYYEYNSGELLSVNTSQHKMVGLNAYNPETGTARLVGGMQYQITGAYTALSLDGETVTPDASGYFTPSADGTLTVTGGDSSTTCVHLVWSGYRNGKYEPYQEWAYPLDSSLTLRGIPKLDASNNLYYDGDTYAPDGTVTRKYGIVDLGTLTWAHRDNYRTGLFSANITGIDISADLVCSKYVTGQKSNTSSAFGAWTNLTIHKWTGNSSPKAVYIVDESYTDAASFKAAMNGVYLVYELETSTTEPATPYTQIQTVDDFGTEEYTDYAYEQGDRDVSIPVGSNTFYPANLRDKLQHLPDLAPANGYYMIQQVNNEMRLVLFRIPQASGLADGTYTLKATVASGTPTYTWVSDTAESEG